MLPKRKQSGKIFISYRRADARGAAGRLSDSLGDYFGDSRVFRDIENIDAGADFGNVIEQNVQTADAVIVLIGPDWLSIKNENGQRRLEDPTDWVAQEISAALQMSKPLFPVLLDNAFMPRAEELPEKLRPLTRYNALSIADDRWKSDVLRLGKIISLDIPSASERKLEWTRAGISFALFASLSFSSGAVCWNFLQGRSQLLQLWQAGAPFVVIISSVLALSSIASLIDAGRRRYIYASVLSGALGSLVFFILLLFLSNAQEPVITFFGSTLTGTLMLAFMNMSGFKAK
jgi:TIR domain